MVGYLNEFILLHTFSHLKWNKIPFYYTNTIYSGIFLNASVLIWYNFSLCIWSRVLSCSHKQLKVGGLNEKEWAGGQRHLWWLAVSSTLRSPFAIRHPTFSIPLWNVSGGGGVAGIMDKGLGWRADRILWLHAKELACAMVPLTPARWFMALEKPHSLWSEWQAGP